jgi:hypothetical protein
MRGSAVFYLAKVIQAVGFADVGYALFVGLTESDALGKEFQLMLLGVAVFYAGRLVERWASA